MQFQLILLDNEEKRDVIIEDSSAMDTLADELALLDEGDDIDTRGFTFTDTDQYSDELKAVFNEFYSGKTKLSGEQLKEWFDFCLWHDDKDEDLVTAFIESSCSGKSASDIISDMDSAHTSPELSVDGPYSTEDKAWESRGKEYASNMDEVPDWLKHHIDYKSLGESLTDSYGCVEFCGQFYTYDSQA